jgi:putative membrane protein
VQSARLKALELRGDGFDEAYGDEIAIAAHEDAIELFEEAAKRATDEDLKRFAADTLPLLKRHLDMGRALRKADKETAK